MAVRDRLALDFAVFLAIIAADNPATTGITVHEWIGIALIVPTLLHLVLNWDWVKRSTFFLNNKVRVGSVVDLVIDAALFCSMVGVSLSGLLVMPGFASALGVHVSTAWYAIHHATADLTITFSIAHLLLHAPRIAKTTRRMLPGLLPTAPSHR